MIISFLEGRGGRGGGRGEGGGGRGEGVMDQVITISVVQYMIQFVSVKLSAWLTCEMGHFTR